MPSSKSKNAQKETLAYLVPHFLKNTNFDLVKSLFTGKWKREGRILTFLCISLFLLGKTWKKLGPPVRFNGKKNLGWPKKTKKIILRGPLVRQLVYHFFQNLHKKTNNLSLYVFTIKKLWVFKSIKATNCA